MPGLRPLGELEQAVMEELWKARSPQTGRHLHNALSVHRRLAYTTITTVLARLTAKGTRGGIPRRAGASLCAAPGAR